MEEKLSVSFANVMYLIINQFTVLKVSVLSQEIIFYVGVQNFSQMPILLGYLVSRMFCCSFSKLFSFPPNYTEKPSFSTMQHCLHFRTVRQGHVTDFLPFESGCKLHMPILCPKISMEYSMLTLFFQIDDTRLTLKPCTNNGRLKYKRHLVP